MKVKIINTIITIQLLFVCNSFSQSVVLFEDFETGSIPTGWTELKVKGKVGQGDAIVNWTFSKDGGEQGHPESALSGSKNAVFSFVSPNGESTKLITPPLDLTGKVKLELSFYNAQVGDIDLGINNDILKVYFKKSPDSAWILLKDILEMTPTWTKRTILLPETNLSDSCYIAFEGTTNWGLGTCIDSMIVVETAPTQRSLTSVTVSQASTDFVPSGSQHASILKIALTVTGNSGTLLLDSVSVYSLNSKDWYVSPNGVKLFYTTAGSFSKDKQVGTGLSFVNGKAKFTGLNYSLPTGTSYLWLTYDIITGHDTINGQLLDAMIKANGIRAGTKNFPTSNQSPTGSRTIYESIFFDDFETNTGWTFPTVDTFLNEFQIDTTCSSCTTPLGGKYGNPDPKNAFSGKKVLGTDVTGRGLNKGDYEKGIGYQAYQAISKNINCSYYKNMKLSFQRWLNSGLNDFVFIDISTDNGVTWNNVYSYLNYVNDNNWSLKTYDISSITRNKPQIKVKFALGTTQTTKTFSGWNIDDFVITGDYITKDVGVSRWISPIDGCGHTNHDTVKVVIKNYGANPVNGPIPIKYSFSGGVNKMVLDTFNGTIAKNDSVIFKFKSTVDLTSPYFYLPGQIYVKTMLAGDEDNATDSLPLYLKVVPTYTLPYTENFENNNGYWRNATDTLWEHGSPIAKFVLESAASGNNVWITGNLNKTYTVNDNANLESPCFNLSSNKNIVFEYKYKSYSQDSVDGAALFYSNNKGSSWNICDTHTYSFKWPWYNFRTVSALNSAGWSGTVPTYSLVKQIMPAGVNKKSTVNFRINFKSDTVYFYEGLAFDDVRIYQAPNDIGATKIVSPVSSCDLSPNERVKIAIKNFNIDTMKIGYKFLISVKMKSKSFTTTYTDTVTVKRNIPVNDTMQYRMKSGFNMHQKDTYNIVAYTNSFEFDNIYGPAYNNDTVKGYVLVQKPFVELGSTKYSVHPDTIKLNAFDYIGNDYIWNDGNTDSIHNVSKKGGIYMVTVTDPYTFCVAKDTIRIVQLIADLGVQQITSPNAACELSDTVTLKVRIKNFGTDTIKGNYTIYPYYKVNSDPIEKDTLVILDTIYPDSTFIYNYKKRVDMSILKKAYVFNCFTQYVDDTITTNDTAKKIVNVWGYPTFDLKPDDTLHVGFSFKLNARKGDTTYYAFNWQDNSFDSIFTVTQQGTGYYSCTIVDVHSCTASDTNKVRLVYPDVQIAKVFNPIDACGSINNQKTEVRIKNIGTDTLNIGTLIPIAFFIDTAQTKYDTAIISSKRFFPGDSVDFTFNNTINYSDTGSHFIKAFTYLHNDSIKTNDTSSKTFTIWPIPVVKLGNDLTSTTLSQYKLHAGSHFSAFKWQDNSTDSVFIVKAATNVLYKNYHVTITDSHNCQDRDTVRIDLQFRDVELSKLVIPDTTCPLTKKEKVKVIFTNVGTITLGTSNRMVVNYKVNGGAAKWDSIQIPASTDYADTFSIVFDTTTNLSISGTYNFVVSSKMTNDIVNSNDTLKQTSLIHASPVVNWGSPKDTFKVNLPYKLRLYDIYQSYLWSNGSTDSTITLTKGGKYKVTVSDTNSCVSRDSIYINIIGLEEIHSENLIVKLYPVPAKDLLNIAINTDGTKEIKVEILNDKSIILINKKYKFSNNLLEQLDFSNLPRGHYYIRIIDKDEIIVRKIIVN